MARIGLYVVGAAPLLALGIIAQKWMQYGWPWPPMVPVFTGLLIVAAVLAWTNQLRLAWVPTALATLLIVPFGLSTGFMLPPVLLGLIGMIIVTAKREVPVAPS